MTTRRVPVSVTRTVSIAKNNGTKARITNMDLQEILNYCIELELQRNLNERPQEDYNSTFESLPEPRPPTKDQKCVWCYGLLIGVQISGVSLAMLDSHVRAFAASILGLPVGSHVAWLFLLGVVVVIVLMIYRLSRAMSS